MVQIFFDEVMCFVDLDTKTIYSAKMKKLKPQHIKKHLQDYYMIKYNNKKSYKSLEQLINIALEQKRLKNETLQPKTE